MGRLWNKIKNGVKKAGRWIGNVAGKVGNVAGVLSNVPVIGGIASTVARGANLVSKVSNGVSNLIERGEAARAKYQPVINKVKEAAQAVHRTGIPDKLTGGAVSRVINRGREIRDRVERRYDKAAGQAQRIGQRIEAGVNKAGGIVQQVVR
jgi:hypothetical protein